MKILLASTAVVLGLGNLAPVCAQTAETAPEAILEQTDADTPGFLSSRRGSDVFASELIGQEVYILPLSGSTAAQAATGDQSAETATADGETADKTTGGHIVDAYAAQNSDGSNNLSMLSPSDLDGMETIGQINEIVLSNNGEVRALVIGVGRYLGVGEKDIAVTMDHVAFAADGDDPSRINVVISMDADVLKASPSYDRDAMMDSAVGQP